MSTSSSISDPIPTTFNIETTFEDKVIYVQFVIGAPGAGKTTYCTAMYQFLSQLGRESLLVDFDPAHEINISPYTKLSLSDFITVDQVMKQFKLGPNGALMYCMEWLEDHLDLIKMKLASLLHQNPNCRYILIDLPGQIELYSHSGSIQRILQIIANEWKFRCVVVHLTDSVLCMEPSHYISSLLVSLSIMLNLQLPHVNVLSKVDLFIKNENGPQLSFFDGNYLDTVATQIDREILYQDDYDEDYDYNDDDDDFEYDDDGHIIMKPKPTATMNENSDNDESTPKINSTTNTMDSTSTSTETTTTPIKKSNRPSDAVIQYLNSFSEINHGIVELIEDFSLVELTHLSVNDKISMQQVLKAIDRANGYTFQDIDLSTMQYNKLANSIPQQQLQSNQTTKR